MSNELAKEASELAVATYGHLLVEAHLSFTKIK